MKIFIIVYLIVSPIGGQLLVYPEQHVSIVHEEELLAKEVQRIKSLGYGVELSIFEATQLEYKYWEEQKEQITMVPVPKIKLTHASTEERRSE